MKLRYPDFSIVTRAASLEVPAQDAAAIRRAAGLCLKKAPLERPIRLLGVRADRLVRANEVREARDERKRKNRDGQLTLPLP